MGLGLADNLNSPADFNTRRAVSPPYLLPPPPGLVDYFSCLGLNFKYRLVFHFIYFIFSCFIFISQD